MKVNSCDSVFKLLARKHDVTTTDAAATNKWSVDFIWMENEGQDHSDISDPLGNEMEL